MTDKEKIYSIVEATFDKLSETEKMIELSKFDLTVMEGLDEEAQSVVSHAILFYYSGLKAAGQTKDWEYNFEMELTNGKTVKTKRNYKEPPPVKGTVAFGLEDEKITATFTPLVVEKDDE